MSDGEQLDFGSAAAALARLDHLDTDAMQLLHRLELSGEDFYNGLADRIGDPRAAELLRRNGREEAGHARRIARALALKLGPEAPTPSSMDQRFPVALPDTIPLEMLPAIVQGELDGDAGYQKWADHEPDAAVAQLLRRNGREETKHGERVNEALAILRGA
jgi:rubrerythrin